MGSKREANVPSGLRFADEANTLSANGAIGYDEQVSLRVGILQEIREEDPNEEQLFRDGRTRPSGMSCSKASRPTVRSERGGLWGSSL